MRVELHPDTLKQPQRLPRDVFGAAIKAIVGLGHNPGPHGVRKLVGRDDWRIRIGRYRIVYEIDEEADCVTVYAVDKRSDVYR